MQREKPGEAGDLEHPPEARWADHGQRAGEAIVRAAQHVQAGGVDELERGEIDPTRIITHTLPLAEAERGFAIFKNKQDNCEKVVLKP